MTKMNKRHLDAVMKSEQFSHHIAGKQAGLSDDERDIFAARFHGAANAGMSLVEAAATAEVTVSMYREHAEGMKAEKAPKPAATKEARLAQLKAAFTSQSESESFEDMMARIRREQG